MKLTFRKFSKRLLIIINIGFTGLFLLACLAAYIKPGTFWFIGVLGVGFVFLLAGLLAFFIFWLLFRSKWAFLSLGALVLGWFQITALFGFHPFAKFNELQADNALRVLQWNVSSWDELNKKAKNGNTYRQEMFDYIAAQDADVLCFQEFFESKQPKHFKPAIDYIIHKLHYPYHYFVADTKWWNGGLQFGLAIFSRYPIVDTLHYHFQQPTRETTESLARATLDVNGRKINIFTTHLRSFKFGDEDYDNIAALKKPEENKDRLLKAGKGILSKFRQAYRIRYLQADQVREQLDLSDYPTIITGDFNDVPNSYTYFTIKGDFQDAFVKKSWGLGRTFFFISPTLRIDYVLTDKNFEVLQYKRDLVPYSDHYPVITDISLKEGG